jgi:hypothetical protein
VVRVTLSPPARRILADRGRLALSARARVALPGLEPSVRTVGVVARAA